MSNLPTPPLSLFFPDDCALNPVEPKVATELKSYLLNDLNAIDYMGNIYIESASFYKCSKGAEHEFLAFRIRDKLEPSRHNVLLLDRVPRVEVLSQPDPTDRVSLDLTVEALEAGRPAPSTVINDRGPLEFSKSKAYTTSDALLSGIITNKVPAADVFFISKDVEFAEMCGWRHLTNFRELEQIKIPHSNFGIEKLVVLAAAVSQHRPLYNLYRHQCYWYAGVLWEVVCKLSGENPVIKSPSKGTATFARFISIAPGNLRNPADDSEHMHTLYEEHWAQFLAEIKPRTGQGIASVTRNFQQMVAERDVAVAERNTALEQLAQSQAATEELRAMLALLQPANPAT